VRYRNRTSRPELFAAPIDPTISIGADATIAEFELLLFRLIEAVGFESDSPPLIEYLVDLACPPCALQIVNNHVGIVAQEALSALGLSVPRHIFPPPSCSATVPVAAKYALFRKNALFDQDLQTK
jgi:hypothetical protein